MSLTEDCNHIFHGWLQNQNPLVIQFQPSTIWCTLFSLNATQASTNWLLATAVSRYMKLIAGNQFLSACSLAYFANCPCKFFSLMPSFPFIYSAFIRQPVHSSAHLPLYTYGWSMSFTDFLVWFATRFSLTTCQIVCTCWMTVSTTTICPAFPRICVPAHLFCPDVSLTKKQLPSSAAYVCH